MRRLPNALRWTVAGAVATALAVVLVLTLGARAAGKLPDDLRACLGQADQANAAHDVRRERQVLEHAATLAGDPRDLATVERRLAVLEWKYEQRYDEARARLLRAAEQGTEPADAWVALARMEQHRKDHAAARSAAVKGIEAAKKNQERRDAGLALARASVAEAVELRRRGEAGDTEPVRQAWEDLRERVALEPGLLEASRLLLTASLLLDQGAPALMAWRSYFHMAPDDPMPNAIAAAGVDLERLLPTWRGPRATTLERIELVRALADSRLFEEGALVALDPRADQAVRDEPRVREVMAYDQAIARTRVIAEVHYRQTILGKGDPDAFEKEVRAQAAPLLATMAVDFSTPPDDDEIGRLLDRQFGAYIGLGRTAGFKDLHMGHRVVDETRNVEQYGHQAELRFVALDLMVSNGFQSWAWESGAQHGGWAGRDAIWQVRPAYAGGGLKAWRRLFPEDERAESDAELSRETALDETRALEDPHAYLPGLSLRIWRQGATGLLERLRERGLTGEHLRLAFLSEYERTVLESSIFAHEGRHAIDKRLKTNLRPGWKSEFYAKLSEVAFSSDPRLALGGILTANIGDDTAHGQANLRIMKGLVEWMKQHRDRIPGLDRKRPLLPQFDLLTDEQIRDAFRSMDPLAKAVLATRD